MTDYERQKIMDSLNVRKEKHLLKEVIKWYEEDFGTGKLVGLINEIKTHLERIDAENKDPTKTPQCPNPFCEGYSVQE